MIWTDQHGPFSEQGDDGSEPRWGHQQSLPGPQSNAGHGFHSVARDKAQAGLDDHGRDQLCLQHGKFMANAEPRSGAKGEISFRGGPSNRPGLNFSGSGELGVDKAVEDVDEFEALGFPA